MIQLKAKTRFTDLQVASQNWESKTKETSKFFEKTNHLRILNFVIAFLEDYVPPWLPPAFLLCCKHSQTHPPIHSFLRLHPIRLHCFHRHCYFCYSVQEFSQLGDCEKTIGPKLLQSLWLRFL